MWRLVQGGHLEMFLDDDMFDSTLISCLEIHLAHLLLIHSTSSADCEACGVGGDQLPGDRGGSLPAQRCSVVSARTTSESS